MGKSKKTKDTSILSQFCFVDVHWEDLVNKSRSPKWRRIRIEEVPTFQQENMNYNVFKTIQYFKNPVHTSPEASYMPFYFDLDSSESFLTILKSEEIKIDDISSQLSKEEILHINNFVNMDIDLDKQLEDKLEKQFKDYVWGLNLNKSKADAIKIVKFFRDNLGLPENDIEVFFSGKKGFHILINPVCLGIEPHSELHKIFKFIALYLLEFLKLDTLDYASIYSVRRMLRLENSIHQSSKLFKIRLNHEELEFDIEEIKNLAKAPREIESSPSDQAHEVASIWYKKRVVEWEESSKAKNKPIIKDTILTEMEDYPVCVQDILDSGIKKSGDRNKATMALASYFKDIGTSMDETEKILYTWVDKLPDSLTSSSKAIRRASTATAIRTIYNDDKYHFACPFIKSLHGERKGKKYEAIKCAGRNCPLNEDHIIDKEEAVKVHLSDTAKADFTGKKVSFDCLVSGKLDTPYIVPKKVVYYCHEEAVCDKECVLHDFAGVMEKEFHENDRVLIEVTHQNDNNLKGILRYHSGTSCKKLVIHIDDYVNIEELLVVPMAERVISTKKDDGEIVEYDESGNEYVSRKVYFVNDKVIPNRYYQFEGYVYPHPKNQFGTIISQKKVSKQDNIESFNLTDEIIEFFNVFQVGKKESVVDRIDTILKDLTDNVTLVWEREDVLLGVLLCYHSALTFYFQDQLLKRGWLETILLGDTGSGKTQLVQNLGEFCGLGEFLSGESSSRTGLMYRLEQMGERWFITWGKYALNDRKLIFIDEVTGLDETDISKMTEARSTGVLTVDRVVNAETNARTRIIFISNPRWGKQLFEFSCGIEALKSVFNEASDIRRLDFALFLATKDVPKNVLNKKYKRPETQLISSQAMKHSILWAWSRKPEDIIITEEALNLILESASTMGNEYGSAEDIPLVSPSDQRIKLARLSVAVASLLHSTDKQHEKIIVKPEHVEFIVNFLHSIYRNKNCRYNFYADNARSEGELSDEERVLVDSALDKLDKEDVLTISKDVLDLFRRNDVLKSQEIQDMTGQTRELINARLAVLSKYNFLKRTRNGFRKLPKFIEYLEGY